MLDACPWFDSSDNCLVLVQGSEQVGCGVVKEKGRASFAQMSLDLGSENAHACSQSDGRLPQGHLVARLEEEDKKEKGQVWIFNSFL